MVVEVVGGPAREKGGGVCVFFRVSRGWCGVRQGCCFAPAAVNFGRCGPQGVLFVWDA